MMNIHSFADDPMVDRVMKMQSALSQAQCESELMQAFAQHFFEISGCTHWLDLSVEGLERGAYSVKHSFIFSDQDDIGQQITRAYSKVGMPSAQQVEKSAVISRLIETDVPKLVTNVEAEQDVTLAQFDLRSSSLLAIPIFHQAEVAQWILLIRPMSLGHDLADIPDVISHINTFSRAMSRQTLLNRVKDLHAQLEIQFEEVLKAQRSLLPEGKPQEPRIDFGVSYLPCELAGGDYYDFHAFDVDKLGVVIADVSGHGAQAAVVMSMLRSLFAAHKQFAREPENVVDDINRVLIDITDSRTFVTAIFVGFDFEKGMAAFSNAGHPVPIWLDRSGNLKPCPEEASPPMGIINDLPDRGGEISLTKGDRLVLYTDGLSEAFDESGREYGVSKLETLVSGLSNLDAQSTAQQIMDDVSRFSQHAKRHDDKCVMVIDYLG